MDLDGDEVQSVRSVCTLSLQEIGAQISEHPMPQQIDRNGVWIDDPDWHQNNSVRDMVKHHILPRTAGTGLGYALKVNHESPLEVAVLVSHSWNENAEEFVETLERTVGADEVLFVCAFAIYQNEDGAGPTVSQQIGASLNCSPFGRVLKNIQEQAHKAGWWWWPRGTIYLVPGLALLLALGIFMFSQLACGGVPRLNDLFVLEPERGTLCGGWRSAGKGTCFATKWVKHDSDPYCRAAFLLTWFFAGAAGVIAMMLFVMQHRVYKGRMIAVPNYQDNLYQRLWCVYEIFMASQLKVYVGLAHTLAPAGKCTARTARCSNDEDEARIRRAIEAFGARCVHSRRTNSHLAVLDMFAAERTDPMAIAAEAGYRKVDATIAWTTSRAQREWMWVIIRIMLLGTALQGSVTVLSISMGLLREYFALGYILAFFSVHAADVGDIASNGVFAAQTPPCAWPAAVGYWRFSGGDSGLVGARRAQSLPRCCRSYGLRIHNVWNIEPFSAFDKDSKIWRPLEGYFSFNGGCADVASFLRSVCCVPTRASLELSKSQLAIPVCICPADLGPQHWPTFAGLLHLVFPFGMGGSNADCGQRSVCD